MRPGLLLASNSDQQAINGILQGFQSFLDRHTGDVNDDGDNLINKFIINNQGVLANNLHFEGGPQDYTPTQCATTEGQALTILGYYYAYKGTGDRFYLDKAIYFFDAYVKYFYNGVPPPNPPAVWRANWMLNAKNPFEVYGRNNPENTAAPGFWGQSINFVNGVGVIPAGAPTFGDQLVKVYQVFTGLPAYQSVRAAPPPKRRCFPPVDVVCSNQRHVEPEVRPRPCCPGASGRYRDATGHDLHRACYGQLRDSLRCHDPAQHAVRRVVYVAFAHTGTVR